MSVSSVVISQSLIQELHEKSIELDKIPGLFTVQKVKPKAEKTKSTRVTLVPAPWKVRDTGEARSNQSTENNRNKNLLRNSREKQKKEM